MLLTGKRSPFRNFSLNVRGMNEYIDNVDTMKYLGLEIDRHLTFKEHLSKLIHKVNQRTRLLWKMRAYIDQPLAQYLYMTLIKPLFGYCDFIFNGCSSEVSRHLQVAQNRALRAVKKM